jgi:hypothetical protein
MCLFWATWGCLGLDWTKSGLCHGVVMVISGYLRVILGNSYLAVK